jgi:DNA-binding transcriptional regulator YhcF (GntR family)
VEFRDNQAIYMQIADIMSENVLSGAWKPGERIPSIRETAETSQVNPNTVMRTYGFLEEKGIIRNQRGVGFFLSDDAYEITRRLKRENFESRELPRMFRIMELLSIGIEELQKIYDAHRSSSGKEKAP